MKKEKLLNLFEAVGIKEAAENELQEVTQAVADECGVGIDEVKQSTRIDIGEILSEIARANENLFTDEELDACVVFFSSPVRKIIERKLMG